MQITPYVEFLGGPRDGDFYPVPESGDDDEISIPFNLEYREAGGRYRLCSRAGNAWGETVVAYLWEFR